MRIIKGCVANVGYEDSNPFSLIEWAAKCAVLGYTEYVNSEFSIALVTKEDKALLDSIDTDWIPICDDEDEVENWRTGEDDTEVIIMSVGKVSSIGDGDISTTVLEGL